MSYRDECEKLYLENIELKKQIEEAKKLVDELWEQKSKQDILLQKIKKLLGQ